MIDYDAEDHLAQGNPVDWREVKDRLDVAVHHDLVLDEITGAPSPSISTRSADFFRFDKTLTGERLGFVGVLAVGVAIVVAAVGAVAIGSRTQPTPSEVAVGVEDADESGAAAVPPVETLPTTGGAGAQPDETPEPNPAGDVATDSPATTVEETTTTSESVSTSMAPLSAEVSPDENEFDPATDLLSLHFDQPSDRSGGHTVVASKVVTDSLDIRPWVIGGASGVDPDTYDPTSEVIMRTAWGEDWTNAHANRGGAVADTVARWIETLNAGGDIWVAEAGQSDLTADVIEGLRQVDPELDTTTRVHVIQHSEWNEQQTASGALTEVQTSTDYQLLDVGTFPNGTADLDQIARGFPERALASQWGESWREAFHYLDPAAGVAFGDTVLVLEILGIGVETVASPTDFADTYFG